MGMGFVLYFDVCALALLLIVLMSNILLGLVKGRTNKFFLLLVVVAIIATLGDLGSGFGANYFHPSALNKFIMYFVNYVYFLAHNSMTPIYFMYCFSSMGIWHIVKEKKWVLNSMFILTGILNLFILSNLIFPGKVFYIDSLMVYQRGPLSPLNYVFFAANVIIGTIIVIKYRKLISVEKVVVMLAILPANIVALLIQGINGKILVEMFMLAMEITMLVIIIQRKDEYVDPITGAKKYNAGMSKFKLQLITSTPITVILVKAVNHRNINMYLGQRQYDEFLGIFGEGLRKCVKNAGWEAEQYFLEYGLFAFVSEEADTNKVEEAAYNIREFCTGRIPVGQHEIMLDPRICIFECPRDINDYNTLVSFSLSFHRTLPETSDVMYYRDFVDNKTFIIKNDIDNIVKNGLANNLFRVYYQPIYSATEKRYVSAEALVRLHDTRYGDISPALFIPAAELSGDIYGIGNFVLDDVCRFISENNLEKLGLTNIQINLSPSQCIEAGLVDRIKECIDKYKISPSSLCLEITEGAMDLEPETMIRNVDALSKMGVGFALDNYGAGYSSLQRLTGFPGELVKLDRAFVEQSSSDDMKIIVEETLSMLQGLGKKVVVSGIEFEETARLFEKLGCEFFQGCELMQGFFYCTALPEMEFVQFINRNS